MMRAAVLASLALLAAGCQQGAPEPEAVATDIPEELQSPAPGPANVAEIAEIGTPMEERVATLGLLNKRNNVSQDIELRPGEQRRIGDVIVRLSACERTAPWELPQDVGAFAQVLVRQRGSEDQFERVFSGWLFRTSPSLNVVEHPIYDVWVKDCAMEFPGEEE